MSNVELYAQGLVCTSACAPKDMTAEQVAKAVNEQSPTGLESRWTVRSPAFKGGEPNGCPCNKKPETHRHWLLEC